MSAGTPHLTFPNRQERGFFRGPLWNGAGGTKDRQGRLLAILLLSLVVGIALLALSCAGSGRPAGLTDTPIPTPTPSPTPTPTPPPDPRALLARGSQQLADEQYLDFTLEHPVGSTPLATGLMLARAEGVASLPDRFRLGLDMEASGTVFKLDVIVVGENAYMTNLFSGAWEPAPKQQIPFRFDFVAESITALLAGMEGPTLMGESDLEGSPAYHIQGAGPTQALSQLIPGALPDATIPVEVWVDKADGRLRQVQLTGPLVTDDLPDTVRVVRVGALDKAPQIEEPEVGVAP